MKKLFAVILAVALMATMSVTAFAMQVYIEITVATGSECIPLEVESTERIEDVRTKIFEKTGTPIALQVLTHKGTTLEDGNTLQDYSIQKDAIIHLSAKATTVTYNVEPTYTVTIPPTVALGETATIKAENVVVAKGKQVEVSIADANGFKATTPEGAELTYTVKNGETAVAEGDTVLAVNPKDGKTGETTLSFVAPTEIQYAGTYTGTATFTVAVKDAPVTTISFTIAAWETLNCTATEGMTWAEYAESDNNEYVIVRSNGRVVVGEGWDIYLSEEPVKPTDVIQNNASYVTIG